MSDSVFRWNPLRPNASPAEIVQRLNLLLPQVQPAVAAAARAAAQSVLRYVRVTPEIVAFTADTVTVRVTGRAPLDPALADSVCAPSEGAALAEIRTFLRELQGTTVLSGGAVDEERPNANEWVLSRPAEGADPGWATFEATLEGAQSDRDQIQILPVGQEIVLGTGPRLVALPVSSDEFTVTVDVEMSWTGAGAPADGTVTVLSHGGLDAADFTPSSWTGPLPLVRRLVISRPLPRTGQGRALFEGTAAGTVAADRDSIDVQEIQQDTIPLTGRVEPVPALTTEETLVVDVFSRDPRDELVPEIAVESFQVVASVTLLESVVTGAERRSRYSIPRPALGAGQGRVNWIATAAGRVSDPLAATVTERGTSAQALRIIARPIGGGSATTYPVVIDASDPIGGAAASYEIFASDGIPAGITGSGTLADPYLIPRPAYGEGTGRVTFRAFKTGRTESFDGVEVPERQRDTVALTLRMELVDKPTASTARYAAFATDPTDAGAPLEVTVEYEQGLGGFVTYDPVTGYFTVTRAPFGSNAGLVGFIAQRTDGVERTPARHPVDVPAVERDTITLPKPTLETSLHTEDGFRATITLSDPLGLVAPDPFIVYAAEGSASYVTGPGGGVSGATLTAVLDITRGEHGTTMGFIRVLGSLAGTVSAPLEIPVPPKEDTSVAGKTLTILPFDFVPLIDTMRHQLSNDGLYIWNPDSANGSTLLYPVRLPPGAVLTEWTVHYRAAASTEVQATLKAGATALDETLGSNTGGVDGVYSGVLSHTVAAEVPLFVRVILQAGLGGTARFIKIVITYTIPSLQVGT